MNGDTLQLIATSAVVSAIVGGLVTYVTQHRLIARKAQLDYEFDAKKRLREAVGPLNFQLLLASRDVVRRFQQHQGGNWTMDPRGYYVKSCVYRLLAPLAVGQLIERKMSLVDFSVDSEAINLLRFLTAAERMLTGNDLILGHPDVDWSNQTQHLFRDNLRAAAASLTISEAGVGTRLLGLEEFNEQFDLLDTDALRDLANIFSRCENNLTENSIFWIRVTGYVYACSEHLKSKSATSLGFTARSLPIDEMIRATKDDHFISKLNLYKDKLKATLAEGF